MDLFIFSLVGSDVIQLQLQYISLPHMLMFFGFCHPFLAHRGKDCVTSQKNVGIEGLISVLESQAHLIIYSYHLLHLNRPELDLTIVLGLGLLKHSVYTEIVLASPHCCMMSKNKVCEGS